MLTYSMGTLVKHNMFSWRKKRHIKHGPMDPIEICTIGCLRNTCWTAKKSSSKLCQENFWTPGLRFFGRIPTAIKMNNVVGCGEVQTYTTCLPVFTAHSLCFAGCFNVPSLQSKDQNLTLWIRGEVIQSLRIQGLSSSCFMEKTYHQANIISNTYRFPHSNKKHAAFCLSSELRPPW